MEIKKAGIILLLGVIASKVEGSVFKLVLMNRLDPSLYGKYSIFLILFNWLLLIATFNITIGLAKFVAENEKQRKLKYVAALIGCTTISLIVSSVLILSRLSISNFINIHDDKIILFLACILPFATIYNLTIFYFRGIYKMKTSTSLDVILSGLKILVLIFMLSMGYAYAPYVAFLVSFLILDLILLFLNIRKSFKTVQFGKTAKIFKALFIYSLPIFLSESLNDFGMGFDRLFLAKFYTTFASGIYDVAITLCLGYILIANAYANALLPVASKDRKNSNKLKKDLLKTSWYVVIFYVIYTLTVLLLAQRIITIINPSYLPAIEFLKPLMIAYALIGFLSLFSYFVNAINLQKYALLTSVLFVLNSFMLNFYFVPQLKYLGAVNAILVSAIVSVVLLTALIWRRLKLKR